MVGGSGGAECVTTDLNPIGRPPSAFRNEVNLAAHSGVAVAEVRFDSSNTRTPDDFASRDADMRSATAPAANSDLAKVAADAAERVGRAKLARASSRRHGQTLAFGRPHTASNQLSPRPNLRRPIRSNTSYQ